ncbi:MAG: hypothetical protein HUU55_21580 [Myxococcales bacterium]|nr:hypothetical protein [Myxococcales bacterium]
MTRKLFLFLLASAFLMTGTAAFAQDPPADEDVKGELHIKMDQDYAKLLVDGEEWTEHEFSDNGKKMLIKALDRSKDIRITLTPVKSEFAPVELVVGPKDFKRTKKKAREYYFLATRAVKFPAAAATPEPPPAPPAPTEDVPQAE